MSKLRRSGEDLLVKTNKSSKSIGLNRLKKDKEASQEIKEKVQQKEKPGLKLNKNGNKSENKDNNKSPGNKFKSEKRPKKRKKEKDDFIIIRRELIGYAPLTYLDLWNKFKVAFAYRDKKSGKTDRKLEEKLRVEESALMDLQSQIMQKLKAETRDMIDGKRRAGEVELYSSSPLFRKALKSVLNSDYFKVFHEIKEIKPNPNYVKYVKKMPVILHFIKDEEDGDILND